jgi:hypothetical protein
MTPIPSDPLQWPAAWPRTKAFAVTEGRFSKNAKRVTVAEGAMRIREELARMGRSDNDEVISTNVPLRLDGFPRSDQAEPVDSGAAVYWRTSRDETKCMAIDRYTRVADNLAAIAATLEAMRAIERHGGAEILDRAFTGFTALPAPVGKPWHVVLGCPHDAEAEHVRRNYMRARSLFHPDKDGDNDCFIEVTHAWKTFCEERGIQ